MKYHHLTEQMRKQVLDSLKSGNATAEQIRYNIRVQYFIDHQDEYMPMIMVNDIIERINKECGSHMDKVPLFIKECTSAEGFMHEFKDGYAGLYEHTLEGELEYLLDWYEHDN